MTLMVKRHIKTIFLQLPSLKSLSLKKLCMSHIHYIVLCAHGVIFFETFVDFRN